MAQPRRGDRSQGCCVDVVAQGIRVNAICPATVDSLPCAEHSNAADPVALEQRLRLANHGTNWYSEEIGIWRSISLRMMSYTTGGVT